MARTAARGPARRQPTARKRRPVSVTPAPDPAAAKQAALEARKAAAEAREDRATARAAHIATIRAQEAYEELQAQHRALCTENDDLKVELRNMTEAHAAFTQQTQATQLQLDAARAALDDRDAALRDMAAELDELRRTTVQPVAAPTTGGLPVVQTKRPHSAAFPAGDTDNVPSKRSKGKERAVHSHSPDITAAGSPSQTTAIAVASPGGDDVEPQASPSASLASLFMLPPSSTAAAPSFTLPPSSTAAAPLFTLPPPPPPPPVVPWYLRGDAFSTPPTAPPYKVPVPCARLPTEPLVVLPRRSPVDNDYDKEVTAYLRRREVVLPPSTDKPGVTREARADAVGWLVMAHGAVRTLYGRRVKNTSLHVAGRLLDMALEAFNVLEPEHVGHMALVVLWVAVKVVDGFEPRERTMCDLAPFDVDVQELVAWERDFLWALRFDVNVEDPWNALHRISSPWEESSLVVQVAEFLYEVSLHDADVSARPVREVAAAACSVSARVLQTALADFDGRWVCHFRHTPCYMDMRMTNL